MVLVSAKDWVEFPVPALIVAHLHVVVCRVLCRVTCTPCWAALCTGESDPCAARRAPGDGRYSRRPRAMYACATTTCSTRPPVIP